jgi:Putative Flp pilus-assembly TadE/G-like
MNGSSKAGRGAALLTTTLLLPLFMAILGLAVDLGYCFYIRREMQGAADAAAIGGANAVRLGDQAGVVAAGKNDAAANGFADGVNHVAVTINNPPSTGSYTKDSTAVEAVISESVPTFFMRVLGVNSLTISTRAVAHLGSGTGCIFALDPTADDAIVVSSSAVVDSQCGVFDNSDSPNALVVNGGGCLTASSILVTGYDSTDSCVSPQPVTDSPPVADPLAYIQPPTFGGCDYTDFQVSGTATLSPGVYCGGITIQPNDDITFAPGTYILLGGGLNISGAGSTVQGTGVTFYNTQNSAYSFGPIVISGGASGTLSAPTDGPFAGILFFQDRTVNSTAQNTLANGTGGGFTGALYFPNSPLVYSGSSEINASYTIVVADTIAINGISSFQNDYSQLAAGSPVSKAVLVE